MKTMIKTALITAILTSISAGAFAAANPFSDVPRSSWAYDAVETLAKDGVISGYGDDTFQGDRAITRYEMAQMTAKAMAKEQVSAKDQATIEKLSAEFADELNTLGVRVSALEAKTDKFIAEKTNIDVESLTSWEKNLLQEILAQEAKSISMIFLGKK